jgi:glycosyltransferase involved in cell wall biosynthesis
MRLSVVTPSLNQAEFIETTLRSVIDQGYPALEYVVIDGGSTDGSLDVIRRCEEELTAWVSEPDSGHANALNKGFAKTTGEIMSWINSSDMYYPWTLQSVADVFSALPQVEWIMGVPTQFDELSAPKSVSPDYFNVYDALAGSSGRRLQQESVFWRRTLWERAGGRLDEGYKCAADFELWLRFFRLAPLYHVDTLLAGFRVHEKRLGEADDGRYQREANLVISRHAATFSRQTLRRTRLVRAIGSGRRHSLALALGKAGVLPWYKHPRVVYDFAAHRWTVR